MTQEELPPYEEESDSSKLPLIIGIGLGLGAVALLSGQKAAQLPNTIKWGGSQSDCRLGQPQVAFDWHSTTLDEDYDVLRDGSIIDTVRGTSWTSNLLPMDDQGQVHTYQIIGKQTRIESPEGRVTTATCSTITDKHVEGAEVLFS